MRTERDRARSGAIFVGQIQDARELAVWVLSIVFASKFTNMYHVPAARLCRRVMRLQYR